MPKRRGRPRHPDLLTPGEWRVVDAVRHGLANPAIARRQGVSLDAVKYHVANALHKLGLASRAELRRWSGVRADSALAATPAKETTMDPASPGLGQHAQTGTLGPIGQVSRSVKDISAARAWYADVLGLPHLYTFGTLSFFDCGGTRLFLSEAAPGVEPGPESVLYFRVADIRVAHAALAARGVAFTHAPHLIHRHADGTEEWMAFFADPEGRPLAIMSQAAPAAAAPGG